MAFLDRWKRSTPGGAGSRAYTEGGIMDDEVALAFEFQVDFQQPPQGGVGHLVQGVRVLPELNSD